VKILVTGSNGQLGNELRELSSGFPQSEFLFTDENELDITSESQVREYFLVQNPDVIINCAAYTAVDKAESEEKNSFLVNSTATGFLAKASAVSNALFIHISTDYVFDGKACLPYAETDKTNPTSVYGRSKYAGELAVHQFASKAIIIRTSWLYSFYGNNFVKTILKYAIERGTLNIVSDQIGTPTYAKDLARAILKILPSAVQNSGVEVYHYSNEGVASWYDFAKSIIEVSGISCIINPIPSKDYPQTASRPNYSVLNKSKIKERFSLEIPYWRDSLKDCIKILKE